MTARQTKTMTTLACGCVVPERTGKFLRWCLRHNFIDLFDLVHNERFVRFYLTKRNSGKSRVAISVS